MKPAPATSSGRTPVVILGGTGFIGGAVSRLLSANVAFDVRVLGIEDFDMTRPEDVARMAASLPRGCSIVLTAAVTREAPDSRAVVEANTEIARATAVLAASAAAPQVVLFSSVDVYGRTGLELPLSESSAMRPESHYGRSKLAMEAVLRKACGELGAVFTVLRPSGVYGPGDTSRRIVPGIIRAAINGTELRVDGDGSQLRDLVFVNDFGGIVSGVLAGRVGGNFNVVTGVSRSLNDMIAIVEQVAGRRIRRAETGGAAAGGATSDLVFRPSALLPRLPGLAFTGLEEGLTETYEYVRRTGSGRTA